MTIGTVTVTAPQTASARTRRILLLAVVILLTVFVAPRAFAGGDEVPASSVMTTYTVASGDTLWALASSLTPAGEDVSEKLAEIVRLNRLDDSTILAGEQILIPLAD